MKKYLFEVKSSFEMFFGTDIFLKNVIFPYVGYFWWLLSKLECSVHMTKYKIHIVITREA